ncbi:MAG: hypothetical protein HYR56_06950 [Acidobacteria bacterium]|nr:hypothetical protein [Acidobacteriota bacterium]MBI3425079.1 hypothetical protein [Acidobacteriota bacterium]
MEIQRHHTKSKGDLGVAKAYCDLVEKGYLVLFPSTEHAPFDLVAYDGTRFIRIQVKYRRANRGVLLVNLMNWWADRNGSHGKQVDKAQVDVFCVYCPDTDKCYYFKAEQVNVSVSLRIESPKNHQMKNVNFADDYIGVP